MISHEISPFPYIQEDAVPSATQVSKCLVEWEDLIGLQHHCVEYDKAKRHDTEPFKMEGKHGDNRYSGKFTRP